MYPTVFQGSQIGIRTIFSVNSFVLYSILKVFKLTRSKSVSYYVLFPTAFLRISNYQSKSSDRHSFCTLQHYQGSQTDFTILLAMVCFVPYCIFKVLKHVGENGNSNYGFVPHDILKVLKYSQLLIFSKMRFPLRCFQGFQIPVQSLKLSLLFCTLRHFQGSQALCTISSTNSMFCTLQHSRGSQAFIFLRTNQRVFCALQHSQGFQAVILCQKMRFLFCALQHFQGSQTVIPLIRPSACFVPYSIFKVLKHMCDLR